MSKRRRFNGTFKAKVVREALKEQKTLLELAQEFKICSTQITKWKGQAIDGLSQIFDGGTQKRKDLDTDIESLYAQIGKLQMQLEFLKKKTGAELD